MACLKNAYLKKDMLFYVTSQLFKKYQFSSNIPTSSKSAENLQFPKQVQPLVNNSVDEILSAMSSKSISPSESVLALKTLRMFTLFRNVKSDTFRTDERFKALCYVFEKNCNVMYPGLLVSGLRSLLEVGVSPDSSAVISAEQSIIDNIQMFSSLNLIGCLYFHHKFMESDLQKKVVSLLVNELCKRISEVTSNAEVLMLVHFLHIFNNDELKIIQQKVIEIIKILNPHEICKIFITLAENSNRNILILNALAFHLKQKVDELQVKEILDILYAFKKLNFNDVLLVQNLMHSVSSEISSVEQPSIISNLLTACGHLRLRHSGVLNKCAEWISSHIKLCRQKEFISFILTIASLNYNSPEIQKTLLEIIPLIDFGKVESADVWLDVVWSLAILNITDRDMLLKVLSPDFYRPLIEDSGFSVATNKLKLMNLKAVLKNYYPECVFSCDLFLDPQEVPQSSEMQKSRRHVIKVLSNFVPKDKYLCTNVNTDMGIIFDAELIMDKNVKPLPLSEYGILSKVSNVKQLPFGAQRIALMILFYKDFTLCSEARSGYNDLAIRLLFSQGYTPVIIPFDEFIRNKTEVNKAKYLLQKITTTMKKVEDNNYTFNIKIYN